MAKCFHAKTITTLSISRMERENVIHFEFDEYHPVEGAKRHVKIAIDNFKNRRTEVTIPSRRGTRIVVFGAEAINHYPGCRFRGSCSPLNENSIYDRIRGIAGVIAAKTPGHGTTKATSRWSRF